MRREYHGGQNARDWRRKVATAARRQEESVFTYKFKLSAQDGDLDFAAATRTYDITEGIARGSLTGLVCAVHLSGFRLFSKGGETHQFRNRSRYPEDAFAAALRVHTEIRNSAITIQSIEGIFATVPRKAGAWSADTLARRLFQDWNKCSPKDGEKDQPEFLLAQGIAHTVTAQFSGWKELAGNATGALAHAGEYLANLGNSFPKLRNLPPGTTAGLDSCTLAYDPEAPFVDMTGNEEIWLHQAVAVCAGRLKRDRPDLVPSSSDFARSLRDSVVTGRNNGLSWLFGKGLGYLRKSSIKQIAEDLVVPHGEQRRVTQLKAFADAIPIDNPFFNTRGYAEFRGSVGGKIASWVSNYWKRLCELRDLHSSQPDITIPETLQDSDNAFLFSGQHTDAAGLRALSSRIPERVNTAADALAVLSGGGIPEPAYIATVESVAGELAELAGQLAMLDSRIQQEIERAQDGKCVNALESLRQDIPRDFTPPKLNSISGGTDDADCEIRRLKAGLNEVVQKRREHFRRLSDWADSNTGGLDPWRILEEREYKALSDRGMKPARAAEYALRWLLNRLGAMSRQLSPSVAEQIRDTMTPLFRNKKEANLYFHNRKGSLYQHPFSTSRHQAYDLDMDRARASDWLSWLEERATELRKTLRAVPNTDHALLRDLLLIEEFVLTTRFGGLPNCIPGHLAKPEPGIVFINIPPLLAAQLDVEEVSRDVAMRAFNLFNSAIKGLLFRAFRDGFIVRTKFLRLDHEELFYVPKERPWQPPADYSSAKGEISKGLELSAVMRDKAEAVLPRETAQSLSKAKFPEPGTRALLRQAPHDWYVELDLRGGTAPALAGLPVKKNATSGLKRWRATKKPAFRLIGPPSFKTWLDRALTDKNIKLGDYTLILDRVFTQSLQLEGEQIRLSAEPVQTRVELAIPVIDDRPSPEAPSLFDHIVAIDLGERRIGYAVFSLRDFVEKNKRGPLEVGSVAIPAFRRLRAAVRRHRGSRQPNQKVGQTYSKALMRFRENVVGDICNRIETLCKRFGGFPVLESSVVNFETGASQLKMIYGSVLRRYTFSEVEAHKTVRRHHWFTADSWDHSYIHTWNNKKRQFSGPSKPLRMFPGVTVNPAGTSQICHRCGRNALQALRTMPDRIEVGEDGHIALKDGTIRLLERTDYSPGECKKFRREKKRRPLNVPVQKKSRPRRDIERLVKRNMRQAPSSTMSPDTTQSRFTCVYLDCGYEGHADENAAINIGRRFLERRIDVERSRAALRYLTGKRK